MERVLVCILAETRAHQVAWRSFKRNVLDVLNADLALAVTINEKYDYTNPYWQHARYKWASRQPADVGESFDLVQRRLWDDKDVPPPDWRSMLRIKGIWQGGIQSSDPQRSFSSNLLYCRSLLLKGLQEDGVLDLYDRFIVTRSDFVWLCPHPPMTILDPESIWIPDGEHYGGLCDRHIVVSRDDAIAALNLLDDILLRPAELYEEMKHITGWNLEVYLKHHLTRNGLISKVKFFPYVMYLARALREPRSAWSVGTYEPSLGHIVKYESELQTARGYATLINTPEDWEKSDWQTVGPRLAASRYRPSTAERVWAAIFPLRRFLSAVWRPGRVDRFQRYLGNRRD